jgi:hypothetical protein
MADIVEGGGGGGGGGRHQKKRAKKGQRPVDMTPMVDLCLPAAHLLHPHHHDVLSPASLPITFPVPNKDETIKTELSNAVTLILTRKDRDPLLLG